jgi:hypothetical protein
LFGKHFTKLYLLESTMYFWQMKGRNYQKKNDQKVSHLVGNTLVLCVGQPINERMFSCKLHKGFVSAFCPFRKIN